MLPKRQPYHHLTAEQRNQIFQYQRKGCSLRQIACYLQVAASTVSREIKRNRDHENQAYLPDTAQKLSRKRRHRPGSKIKRSKDLQHLISDWIAMSLSPEVIAGRLKQEVSHHIISHESIYKWIYGDGKPLKLYEYLLRHKRSRGLRPSRKSESKIPNRVSIHERPHCEGPGHWEGDTIHFAGHKGGIVTIYDKATKMTLGAKMSSLTSAETIANLETILSKLPEQMRQTMTFDNGSEFTGHEQLKKLLSKGTYFCDPHSPWQKGGIENANGIIRRRIKKGSKADEYSAREVQEIIHQINMTPRKSLDYRSPYEMLLKTLTGQDRTIYYFKPSVALRV